MEHFYILYINCDNCWALHYEIKRNWDYRTEHAMFTASLECKVKVKVKGKSLSCVRLFATPWTVAHQAPPSMGFSRQEYWSGLPFSSPGDLPDPGIEPRSPAIQADALTSEPPGKPLFLPNWAGFLILIVDFSVSFYDLVF